MWRWGHLPTGDLHLFVSGRHPSVFTPTSPPPSARTLPPLQVWYLSGIAAKACGHLKEAKRLLMAALEVVYATPGVAFEVGAGQC